jgi:hypothetical protein
MPDNCKGLQFHLAAAERFDHGIVLEFTLYKSQRAPLFFVGSRDN